MVTFDVLSEKFYLQTLKTNSERFYLQTIKANVVICRQAIQGFADIVIPLPAQVTIDPTTGQLSAAVTLEPAGTPILINNTVLADKVINNGAIPVNILIAGIPVVQYVNIPWHTVIDCPGSKPGDEVEIEKQDFHVVGYTVTAILGTPGGLTLNAIFNYCLIVSRLKLIEVSAADVL